MSWSLVETEPQLRGTVGIASRIAEPMCNSKVVSGMRAATSQGNQMVKRHFRARYEALADVADRLVARNDRNTADALYRGSQLTSAPSLLSFAGCVRIAPSPVFSVLTIVFSLCLIVSASLYQQSLAVLFAVLLIGGSYALRADRLAVLTCVDELLLSMLAVPLAKVAQICRAVTCSVYPLRLPNFFRVSRAILARAFARIVRVTISPQLRMLPAVSPSQFGVESLALAAIVVITGPTVWMIDGAAFALCCAEFSNEQVGATSATAFRYRRHGIIITQQYTSCKEVLHVVEL